MLTPLPGEDWDDHARQALASILPAGHRDPINAGNALATLVRHPALAAVYLPFNVYLMGDSTLPERWRELAILRVAHRTNCVYEWGHHVPTARATGLTDADIEAVREDYAAIGAEIAFDRTILCAVDELLSDSRISPSTWVALGERFDDRQRMDLIFTVGGYAVLASALNTFGVELESEGLAAEQLRSTERMTRP